MMRGGRLDGRGARSAWLVPAAGVVSALVLVGAALFAVDDPDGRGRAVFAQQTAEAHEALLSRAAAWQRSPERLLPFLVEAWSWDAAPPDVAFDRVVGEPLERDGEGSLSAFDALLGEAERLEREDDVAGALELVLEALEKSIDAPRRAEGRLRAIQYAARLGSVEVARAQWELASAEFVGSETRQGRSWLQLCGLAAAPVVDHATRAGLGARLVDALIAGELPDGAGEARIVGGVIEDPLRVALRERLRALVIDDEPRLLALERHAAWQRARAVSVALGGMPEPALDERWTFTPVEDAWLASWRDRDGRHVAGLVRTQAFALEVLTVDPTPLRSVGFSTLGGVGWSASDGSPDPPARLVSQVSPLFDGMLTCALVHRDPDARIAEIAGRAWGVRIALLVAALFSLAASLATARALQREARLARLRSAFVASVSHELRTPVASVLLMSENLVTGRAGDASHARYHALIHREAQRLRRLVDDVLDVSRLERGREPSLRIEEVDAVAWWDELAADAARACDEAGATCAIRRVALPEVVVLDAEAVRRAVLNLVDNALKHGCSGDAPAEVELGVGVGTPANVGGRPTSRATANDAPVDTPDDATLQGTPVDTPGDAKLEITVRDRGPGLPRSRRAALFEPFERGRDDATGPPGTGLGLAIVRAIVRAHGGEVTAVDARPGARFVVVLPCDAGVRDDGADDEHLPHERQRDRNEHQHEHEHEHERDRERDARPSEPSAGEPS